MISRISDVQHACGGRQPARQLRHHGAESHAEKIELQRDKHHQQAENELEPERQAQRQNQADNDVKREAGGEDMQHGKKAGMREEVRAASA